MGNYGFFLVAAVIIITAAIFVAVRSANYISEIDRHEHSSIKTITELAAEAEHIANTISKPELQETAIKVCDALRYSDPVSTVSLEEADLRIQREFDAFKSAAMEGDVALTMEIANELILLIDKRNLQCRVMK